MEAEAADVRDGDDIAGFAVSRSSVDDGMRKHNVRVFEPLRRRSAEVDRVMVDLDDDRRDELVRERLTKERRMTDQIWDEGLLAVIDSVDVSSKIGLDPGFLNRAAMPVKCR